MSRRHRLAVAVSVFFSGSAAGAPQELLENSTSLRQQLPRDFRDAHASEPDLAEFESFVDRFGKGYGDEEWESRFSAFRDNLAVIRQHNAMNHSVRLDLNEHADVTPREFARARSGGLNPSDRRAEEPLLGAMLEPISFSKTLGDDLPDSVDWVKRGALTPVENQGRCGGCWAFSATSALSAAWQIATGRLVEISKQQLMDCSTSFGNQGCRGGNMDNAFKYAKTSALCTQSSYQYRGDVGTCRKDDCQVAIPQGGVMSFKEVPAKSEEALLEAVSRQPVAVGIEAEEVMAFQFYKSGVMSGLCGSKPNHAVLVVGYGTEAGQDYWLVQNSWGSTWGLNGYFKLKRGPGPTGTGECGILTMPSYPVIDAAVAAPVTPAETDGGAPAPSPPASQAFVYGEPPCASGVNQAVVSDSQGKEGRMCTPECTASAECPAPGSCVLKEHSLFSVIFGRQFCAIVCKSSSECPGSATCSSQGLASGQSGICTFPTSGSAEFRGSSINGSDARDRRMVDAQASSDIFT